MRPDICLRSLTYIETAQIEGWANFFASAMMNYRSSSNGYWAITSKTYKLSGGSPSWDSTPPIQFDLASRWKWMENYCDDDMNNHGVITDWVQFFWQVWATGGTTDRWDISLLSIVWYLSHQEYGTSESPYDRYAKWDNIEDVIFNNVSSISKRNHFHNLGDYNGVDH